MQDLLGFLFFPLWGGLFVVLAAIEVIGGKLLGLSTPKGGHGILAVPAAILAGVAIVWLNCAFFIELPFAQPACAWLGF